MIPIEFALLSGLALYVSGYWLGLQWTERRRRLAGLEVDRWLSRLRGRS